MLSSRASMPIPCRRSAETWSDRRGGVADDKADFGHRLCHRLADQIEPAELLDAIVRELRNLGADETLLIQSGKPVGVFRTHTTAPRVLLANSNLALLE